MPLRRFSIAGLLLLLAAASAPPQAQAVSFSGSSYYPVGSSPTAVAVGDFNEDFDPDLAVTSSGSGSLSVPLGGAGGGFTGPSNFPVGDFATSVAVGDFNGDSNSDLAVPNGDFGLTHLSVLFGNGSGGFSGPTDFPAGPDPQGVAVGDFNGDSRPDLAVANFSGNDVSILLGDGTGGFSGPANFPANSGPTSVAVGKFNGDLDPDLAVANLNSNDVSILLGGAGGTFTGPSNFTAGSTPSSVAVGDFDGDGNSDVTTSNYGSDDVSILLGNGTGGLTGPTNIGIGPGAHPRSVAVADFDGDSGLDVAVVSWSTGNASILLGTGGGGFTGPTNFPAGNIGVAVGDFNADARLDLAAGVYCCPGQVGVLLNTTPPPYDAPAIADTMHIALVPNFRQAIGATQCSAVGGSPSTHGSPLAFSSCNPPGFVPGTQAHTGIQATSSADIAVVPGDSNPGNGDQADVALSAAAADVRQGSATGPDYDPVATGSDMTALAKIRISDRLNTTSGQGCAAATSCSATTIDIDFAVPITCTATSDPSTGSNCNVSTTADAVVPDVVKESKRSVIQVFRVRLKDAGANDAPGDGDDRDALMQGIYIP